MDLYSFKNFKSITNEEVHLVFEWRNHIEIRKWMYNEDLIPFDKHIMFIENLKSDDTKQYWLVQRKGIYTGITSIVDYANNKGEMGYYISPYLHKMNIGIEFYYFCLEFLFEKQKIQEIDGYALASNSKANSISRFFETEGELIQKIINGKENAYYFNCIVSSKWFNEIKNDSKIQRILNITKRM